MANAARYVLGARRYQVVAPLVVVKLTNGNETYVDHNGLLPPEALGSHVEHLLEHGMIRDLGSAQ